MIYWLFGLVALCCVSSVGFANAQGTINCNNSVGGNNSGSQTNNCGNLYLRPPPQANVIYQGGREIANVDAPLQINPDGTCSLPRIFNTRLDDIQNPGPPLQLDGHFFTITHAVKQSLAEMTDKGMITNVITDIQCKIIQ